LKSRNSTLAVWSDGHLNYAALLHCGRFENSTTCGDANGRLRLSNWPALPSYREARSSISCRAPGKWHWRAISRSLLASSR